MRRTFIYVASDQFTSMEYQKWQRGVELKLHTTWHHTVAVTTCGNREKNGSTSSTVQYWYCTGRSKRTYGGYQFVRVSTSILQYSIRVQNILSQLHEVGMVQNIHDAISFLYQCILRTHVRHSTLSTPYTYKIYYPNCTRLYWYKIFVELFHFCISTYILRIYVRAGNLWKKLCKKDYWAVNGMLWTWRVSY